MSCLVLDFRDKLIWIGVATRQVTNDARLVNYFTLHVHSKIGMNDSYFWQSDPNQSMIFFSVDMAQIPP